MKNPRSCADINRKPVVTVDSYGNVNSPAKSIDTGIIGTRKNAAPIKLIAIISTSSVWITPTAMAINTNEPTAEITTITLYLWYRLRKKPAVKEDTIPVMIMQAPSPAISALEKPNGPKSWSILVPKPMKPPYRREKTQTSLMYWGSLIASRISTQKLAYSDTSKALIEGACSGLSRIKKKNGTQAAVIQKFCTHIMSMVLNLIDSSSRLSTPL